MQARPEAETSSSQEQTKQLTELGPVRRGGRERGEPGAEAKRYKWVDCWENLMATGTSAVCPEFET